MTTPIEWNAEQANSESATLPQKLLNTLVPLHNELAAIEAKYNAATDIEAAVTEQIASTTDEESLKLKKQIEQANALIAKNTAQLEESARTAVLANIDPEFDEAKYVAKYNDVRNDLKKKGESILGTFDILNFVEAERTPTGRVSTWKGLTPEGEMLLKVLEIQKLGKSTGTTAPKTDPAVVEFNKAAKAWAKEQGIPVADKGALSNDVKEKYAAASGTVIPS